MKYFLAQVKDEIFKGNNSDGDEMYQTFINEFIITAESEVQAEQLVEQVSNCKIIKELTTW